MATLSSVASLAKERSAWNKVMTSTYGVKLKGANRFKRATRTKVNKRAARARKAGIRNDGGDARTLHDSRLDLLDKNNHNDDNHNNDENNEDDDDYEDSEYEDEEEEAGSKRKRKSVKKARERKAKKAKGGKKAAQAKALERKKLLPRPCTLEQALLDPEADALYSSAMCTPKSCKPRKFCPVTGVVATYRDPSTNIPYSSKAALILIAERAPKIW